jgi:cell wall-associated NlpC family hydrolase
VAFRLSRRVPQAVTAVVSIAATALIAPQAFATPGPRATPDAPTTASVQQQLSDLAMQNTQLVEQFDQAQGDVQAKQAAAEKAKQQAAAANAVYDKARDALGATAAAQYEGGSFSATGALLSSGSGQGYLDQLQTLTMLSSHTAQVVTRATDAQAQAVTATKTADQLLTVATAKRDALAQQRADLQKQVDKYLGLLATLTAQQRALYLQQTSPSASSAAVSSLTAKFATNAPAGAASQAVRFALAQVGKPYVYGAAGPGSWDCSGLTMAAWASAGVSLPHSAAGQYNYGTHVAFAQLQPGDLLFYYQPIGHVTIYVGDGMMVSAPQSGENVKVMPAAAMSGFVGASRLVGG